MTEVQVLHRVTDDAAGVATRNRNRAWTIASAPAVVLVVLGMVIGEAGGVLVLGLIVGVVLGAAAGVGVRRSAPGLVLRSLQARVVDDDEVPGPATLVEGLCASMGLGQPELYLVDDPAPNALAVGRTSADAVLVLTTGLLSRLGPVELEGVLAHELAHMKRDDVAPATMAAALALLMPLPGAAALVHRLAGRGRECAADRHAVVVTRYPPGLSQALVALSGPLPSEGSAVARRRVGQVTRWLWTAVLPDTAGRRPEGDDVIGELDAPSVRVAALDEW